MALRAESNRLARRQPRERNHGTPQLRARPPRSRSVQMRCSRSMASLARDARAHVREIRPGSYSGGMAVEAAVDSFRILHQPEGGFKRAGRFARVSHGSARTSGGGIERNAMFEITAIPETHRCICLSTGTESPVQTGVNTLTALCHAKQKVVRTNRILKRNTGTFPNGRFGKQRGHGCVDDWPKRRIVP